MFQNVILFVGMGAGQCGLYNFSLGVKMGGGVKQKFISILGVELFFFFFFFWAFRGVELASLVIWRVKLPNSPIEHTGAGIP